MRRCALFLGALFGVTLASALPARAGQERRDLNNPAFVEVEIDAEAEIENAERLLAEGRAGDAVVALLQVRRRYPARLHLLTESDGRFQIFVPIRDFVDRTLLALPGEGRRVFLRAADPEAERALAAALAQGGTGPLEAFLSDWAATTPAARARRILGDLLAEKGRFHEALRSWEPLLAEGRPDAALVKRLALAYARVDRHEDLERLIAAGLPGAADVAALAQRHRAAPPPDVSFLDPGHGAPELRWRYRLAPRTWIVDDLGDGEETTVVGQGFELGGPDFSPLHPASTQGLILLNPGREQEPPRREGIADDPDAYPLVLLHARTGRFVVGPSSLEDGPSFAYAYPQIRGTAVPQPRLDVTVAGGRALSVRWVPGRIGDGRGAWTLAALDLEARGDACGPFPKLWDWAPDGQGVLLGPGPATDGERVFVTVTEVKQEIHNSVVALDARTGRERWRTFVSAYPRTAAAYQPSPLLVGRDAVYVATNLGTVAALNADTGAPLWILKYAVPGEPPGPFWHTCPLLLSEGVLIASPRDFPFPLALDPASGRLLWSFWEFLDMDRFRQMVSRPLHEGGVTYDVRFRHLLGLGDGLVVYSSVKQVHTRRIANGLFEWNSEFGLDVTGRGCVYGNRVLVPTPEGVAVLGLDSGRRAGQPTPGELLFRWKDFGLEPENARFAEPTGWNLSVVEDRGDWCFRAQPDGAGTCRGCAVLDGKGDRVCASCLRPLPDTTEIYLVAANRDQIACIRLGAR